MNETGVCSVFDMTLLILDFRLIIIVILGYTLRKGVEVGRLINWAVR